MEITIPMEKRELFLRELSCRVRKINHPRSFEPFGLLFNSRIREKAFYGNIGNDSFWLRSYSAKGYEARLPGRYCHGRIVDAGDCLKIKLSWRFTLYWPIALIIIYLLFLLDVEFSGVAIALSMPIYLVVCLAIFVMGIGMHEKEEQQVVELLKSIRSLISTEEKPDDITP